MPNEFLALSLSTPQTILVIEDKISFAQRLTRWLENQGHTVYAYAGVESVENAILTGLTPITSSTSDNVDLSKIQVCFLDHYFEGETFNGTSLTRLLTPMGIKICGMSSVDPANQSMLRSGAICAYRKDILSRLLT